MKIEEILSRLMTALAMLTALATMSVAAPTDPFTHPGGLAGSKWEITRIDGQPLDPVFAATILFKKDHIFVDENCPFFLAFPKAEGGMELVFADTFVACKENTPQQEVLENVFKTFRHFQFDENGNLTIVSEDGHWITANRTPKRN